MKDAKSELAESIHLQQKNLQAEHQKLLQGLASCSTIEEAEVIQEQITVVLQKITILKIPHSLTSQ